MTNNITHILVVDDDNRIRDLLGKFLKDSGYFVSVAKGAKSARDKIKEFIFDIIVLDVMMPGESGIEFTEKLRSNNAVPILMLTAMGETEDKITGLESGADDYLPKPFEPRELLIRIKRILQRTKTDDIKKLLTFGDIVFDRENGSLKKNGTNVRISSNESKLLNILCDNIGRTVSRDEMAILCGGINERSVDVQITRLRNKIEQNPKRPIYLKTVRGKGYVLHEG